MGPTKIFHKNRSQHSLFSVQDANEKRYQIESPLHSPALRPPSSQYDGDEEQGHNPYQSEASRYYQSGHPTRSQSQRSPSQINTNLPQPTIHLVGPAHSTPSSAVDEPPDRYYRQEYSNPPTQKEDRKKRRFFGLGGGKEPASTSSGASGKLGRSVSVRRKEQPPEILADVGRQHHWSSAHVSPTDDYEEEEEGGAGLRPSSGSAVPPPPEKDPLRSPGLPPHQEHTHGRSSQQRSSPNQSNRQPSDRQGSHHSSWDRAAQAFHQHTHGDSAPQAYHPSPSSAISTSSQASQHRSQQETLHEPWQDQPSRPSSQQSLEPPLSREISRSYESHHARTSSSQASSLSYTPGSMGPPAPQQSSTRRPSEAQQHSPGDQAREGSGFQQYTQGGQGIPSNAPPQYSAQLAPQGQVYRGGAQSSPMQQQGSNEERRGTTPPPRRSQDNLTSLEMAAIRYDELQDKYRKVKKYYFDKDAQVQQLQNTLAHQRLSQSRTSLDDNEYANRFSRLDGAINNLAFNIRRDWRSVSPWLAPHVNRDATTSPTKEMTAVGRASISRWLVDELFDRFFHPGLEPGFSSQLKIIEKNLRRFAPPTPSDEEKDALLAKISNWRLSTLDGLQESLSSPQAAEYRATLTDSLVDKLVATLSMMLKEPPPPGLDNSASMIVELAVGIAANLPLESRDVFIEYVVPGQLISEHMMKVETGLPALTNPGSGIDGLENDAAKVQNETGETGSIDSRETGNSNGNNGDEGSEKIQGVSGANASAATTGKKKNMFSSMMTTGSGAKKGGPSPGGLNSAGSQGQGQQAGQGGQGKEKEERVRFSTFMAVEVRGRSVLVKAPVYVRES